MTTDQIKDMQRRDPVAKEQWYAYCEEHGNNVRDPSKHDPPFLDAFIQSYHSGVRLEFKEGKELVQMIKMGQKMSQGWKAMWEAYCNGTPVDGRVMYDPAKHDAGFLEGFFDFIGKMAAGGVGVNMMGGRATMSTGDPTKDALIAKIKAFQRQGDSEKQIWHTYCDTSLGGVYDPSRQEVAALRTFVQQNGIENIPVPASGPVGGPSRPLVLRIKNYQKTGEAQKTAWHEHCDASLGGIRDPGRHDDATLQAFCTQYGVP